MKRCISQRISYHVRTYDYSKNNSRVGFYMSVTIDRNTKRIPLDIYFYKELFDPKSEQIRLDGINNKEITDLNLMIKSRKRKN